MEKLNGVDGVRGEGTKKKDIKLPQWVLSFAVLTSVSHSSNGGSYFIVRAFTVQELIRF